MPRLNFPPRWRSAARILWIVIQLVIAIWMSPNGGQFYYQGF